MYKWWYHDLLFHIFKELKSLLYVLYHKWSAGIIAYLKPDPLVELFPTTCFNINKLSIKGLLSTAVDLGYNEMNQPGLKLRFNQGQLKLLIFRPST